MLARRDAARFGAVARGPRVCFDSSIFAYSRLSPAISPERLLSHNLVRFGLSVVGVPAAITPTETAFPRSRFSGVRYAPLQSSGSDFVSLERSRSQRQLSHYLCKLSIFRFSFAGSLARYTRFEPGVGAVRNA